jgi:Mg2+/Co2+ transporter CorB
MDLGLSIGWLFALLIFLLLISAFFSSAETSMMAVNRYKLRHMAKHSYGARKALQLLERIDRLLTVVLIGNTIANIFASAIITLIGAKLDGERGAIIATMILTFVILIFSEIGPKSITARYPLRYAIFASLPLQLCLWIFYPLVWFGNNIVRLMLLPFGINISTAVHEELNTDELKLVVHQTGTGLSKKEQDMLIRILEMEQVTVEDIMIPRSEIIGIDLDDTWEQILTQLHTTQYTRLPLYTKHLDDIQGVIHVREILHLLVEEQLTKEALIAAANEPYYVPETIPLNKQLLHFQKNKASLAFVVDEYGNVQGLISLAAILEEVVGKFTTDTSIQSTPDIYPQADGSIIVDGSITLRELNRHFNWHLQSKNSKTLNGLLTEQMGDIPTVGIHVCIGEHCFEILKLHDNIVKAVKIIAAPTPPKQLDAHS